MALSLSELVSAVFSGAPTPELTEKYTAQITALISLYICFIAIFLIGLYIRAVKKRPGLTEERRLFKVWIAWSSIYAILMITAFVFYFLMTVS
jgi:hypothetical protein